MNSLFEYVSPLDDDTKNHGNHNENKEQRILNAGQISMVYEQGNLRSLSIRNHEIIRMIYTALRAKELLYQ